MDDLQALILAPSDHTNGGFRRKPPCLHQPKSLYSQWYIATTLLYHVPQYPLFTLAEENHASEITVE
jgi:hypothetical protein